jgi:hypothetical protein
MQNQHKTAPKYQLKAALLILNVIEVQVEHQLTQKVCAEAYSHPQCSDRMRIKLNALKEHKKEQ